MTRGASCALGATCSAGHLSLAAWRTCPLGRAAAVTAAAAPTSASPALRHPWPAPPPLPPPGPLLALPAIWPLRCRPPSAATPPGSSTGSSCVRKCRCWATRADGRLGLGSASPTSNGPAARPTKGPTGARLENNLATAAAAATTAPLQKPVCGGGTAATACSSSISCTTTNSTSSTSSSSSSSSSSSGGNGDISPQLPLCRRPAVHVDELAAALTWKVAMTDRISQLGDSLERLDGGPDMAGLLRELDWVLDDVIEAVRPRPDSPWEETSWRMLEPRVRAVARSNPRVGSSWQLRLREPVARLWEWWERRLMDRVPFQYLISAAHWHRYVLAVGPGVLVPRPETEIFPELVRTAITARPYLAAVPWADLGTGSGAIAISAADELRRVNPAAVVWAVDLSPAAVAYAAFNARLCLSTEPTSQITAPPPPPRSPTAAHPLSLSSSTAGPVRVVHGSWFEPLQHLRGRLGGVLSNPPYIPRAQMRGLQAEVRRHEPAGALDGGEGPGLDSLERLCRAAAEMLAPGGLIALETAGGEQADMVADLLRAATLPSGTTDTDAGTISGKHADGSSMAASNSTYDGCSGIAAAATAVAAAAVAAFEDVEVLQDCYGVRRFVRAYRRRLGGL